MSLEVMSITIIPQDNGQRKINKRFHNWIAAQFTAFNYTVIYLIIYF